VRRCFPAYFDVRHFRAGWSLTAPRDEIFDSSPRAFGYHLYAAVGRVRDPAGDAQALGLGNGGGAEIDSLHSTVDLEMNADVI